MDIITLIPVIYTVVGMVKRFIPDNKRTYANPVIAVVTGLLGAYATGGSDELLTVIFNGFVAGAGAIGAYSVPKATGVNLFGIK